MAKEKTQKQKKNIVLKENIDVSPEIGDNLFIAIENAIEPTEAILEKYAPYYQGKFTNIFTEVSSKKTKHTIKEDTGQMLFTLEEMERCSKSSGSYLTIPINNNLSVSSSKLFDYLTLLLTGYLTYKKDSTELAKHLTVDISVSDYMQKRGLKKKDRAVAQLKKDAETLFNARMTVTEQIHTGYGKRRKLEEHKSDIRILDKIPNKDDKIRDVFQVHIALSLAEYLTQHQLMQYPLSLLLTTNNNNVYYIGKFLTEHYNMNQLKTNKDSISVKALLEHTPEIPTLEEEKKNKRDYRNHCIEPLERTLDQLQKIGLLTQWHFLNEQKKQIPQEKLEAYSLTFDDWNRYYIHFVLADYPQDYSQKISQKIVEAKKKNTK